LRSGTKELFDEVAGPVDLTSTQQSLRPILEAMEKKIPVAQRQASPGLMALKQVVDGPPVVGMDTAIGNLSAIQNISRVDPAFALLKDSSKAMAAQVVPLYRQAIDAGARAMGQGAVDALTQGRAATKLKYEVGQFAKSLPAEPVKLVERLIQQKDKSVEGLRKLQQHAPQTLAELGESVLTGIFEKALDGDLIKNIGSASTAWKNLGSRTKQMLYTAEQIENLDKFFTGGKLLLERANPSGSAITGGGWYALHELMTNTKKGIANQAKVAIFSRLLLNPDGYKYFTEGMGVPGAKIAARGLQGVAAANVADYSYDPATGQLVPNQ
jgi:hypothetical protein